ncbi:MAG: glycosyltransferase [Deltaproteobacteria bacterium]|nr:glycosyltransferase [Deltaproteobacteria bacterium]
MASGRRIRLVHVITRMDRGGSAQNTLDTAMGLAKEYDTHLVHGPSLESAMGPAERARVEEALARAEAAGVSRVVCPHLVRAVSPARDLAALRELKRLFSRLSPDVVHTHTSKAGALGRLAAAAAGVPAVIHTPHGHVFYGHFGPVASRGYLAAERFLDRFTHVLVALTTAEARDYEALGVARKAALVVVHSGVDVERFAGQGDRTAARAALGLSPDAAVVGCVGGLWPHKGQDVLLSAMARVWEIRPDAVLVFAGQGPMEEELRRRAGEMGAAGRVVFAGWRDDLPQVLPALDVMAHPAKNEGMGRVLVEALAAGVPVAASDAGGIRDVILHGRTGLLVPAGDQQAMAGAVSRLLSDPALAARLVEKGREHAKAFSRKAMLAALNALYREWTMRERA